MKERKKFFDNNRLNKGHKKLPNPVQSDANVVRKKYQHILPPIEMLEHYEELNPGTIDKLLDMAQKEQNHRHSIDLITIEKYNKATKLGRMFSLVFVALISVSSTIDFISHIPKPVPSSSPTDSSAMIVKLFGLASLTK